MNKKLLLTFTVLMLLVTSCNLPTTIAGPQSSVQGVSMNLVTPDPNATATPTPFQPGGQPEVIATTAPGLPTNTPAPTKTSTVTLTPTPTPIPRVEGQVRILLLGSDWRPDSGYRTDVILLVSLNPKQGTASVVSFPRDLWVTIPGWEEQRINTAQAHGGFDMMADTLEYNFNARPDYYVMTNFEGFKGIINTLGGVNVYASQGLRDKCDLPQADEQGYCGVGPGWVSMDGDTALWYVRSRYSSSDFDRLRRAQEVVAAMFTKLMNLNAIGRIPELYRLFSTSVETDLPLGKVVELAPFAATLTDFSKVRRYEVSYDMITPYRTSGGAAVLLPNYEAINAMIIQAVYTP